MIIMNKKNKFSVIVPEIGEPLVDVRFIFCIDSENIDKFKTEFYNLIDKYKVTGVL